MSEPEFTPEIVELSSLKTGPIQHEVLPDSFVVRARLVHAVIGDPMGAPLEEFLQNFQRDLDPESELRIWERVALVISDLSRVRDVTARQKGAILSTLLFASAGVPASELIGKSNDLEPELREAAATAARELGFG